jgi:hypothetical protein
MKITVVTATTLASLGLPASEADVFAAVIQYVTMVNGAMA